MVYGDLKFLDIIVFAAVAVFLIYRLRGVLGKRSGLESNPKKSKTNKKTEPNKQTNTPQLNEGEEKFSLVYDVVDDFDHKKFLEGAKFAFEAIINAFNKGDKKTLKNLLTKDVFISFDKAINENNNNPGFQFYSLTIGGIEDVVVKDEKIKITLKIISEQFKDDDESTITKKQDLWTFEKKINDKSPVWLLSST